MPENGYIYYIKSKYFSHYIAGVIYDRRKSYDDVFYVVGALYLLAALVFTAIPIIGKCCKRRSTH